MATMRMSSGLAPQYRAGDRWVGFPVAVRAPAFAQVRAHPVAAGAFMTKGLSLPSCAAWAPAAPVLKVRMNGTVGAAVLVSSMVMGCAAPTAPAAIGQDGANWRVEPLMRVDHAGTTPAVLAGHVALARRYEGEQRWTQAAQAWQEAVRLQPGDVGLRMSEGIAWARAGQPAAAVEAMEIAEALAPADVKVINNLGYALHLAGQAERAVEKFRLVLLLQPGHARASRNLAWANEQRALAQASGPAGDGVQAAAARPTGTDNALGGLAVESSPRHATAMMVQTAPSVASLIQVDIGATRSATSAAAEVAQARDLAVRNPDATPTRVLIANGVGITGAATQLLAHLQNRLPAVRRAALLNLTPYRQVSTVLRYRAGFREAAQRIAATLPSDVRMELAGPRALDPRADVQITLGHDHRAGWQACAGSAGCSGPAGSPSWARAASAQPA